MKPYDGTFLPGSMKAANRRASFFTEIAALLAFVAFALLASLTAGAGPASASGLFAVSPDDDKLRVLNPANGTPLSMLTISLAGATVNAGNGLAVDPTTSTMWAILKVDGIAATRRLVTIEPLTAVATSVGTLSDRFAGLAFDDIGTLYGVTGDGAANPERLFGISKVDASSASVTPLGNGTDGEAIAFHPGDGLLYHASGIGTPNLSEIFETIDVGGPTITNVALSGQDYDELTALAYDEVAGDFVGIDLSSTYLRITDTGVVTFAGTAGGVRIHGLAFFSEECGNGDVGIGESCDDGNVEDGDCCSSTCRYEALHAPCTDDLNVCTDDACDGSGTCVSTNNNSSCEDGRYCTVGDTCSGGMCGGQRDCADTNACTADSCDEVGDACVHADTPIDPGLCLGALKGKFQITDSATAGKDKLSWQIGAADAFDQAVLGTPEVAMSTTYTLCVYDNTAMVPSLEASIDIAASNLLWTNKSPKGLAYKDKSGGSEGVTKARLKTGAGGKTKVKVKAGGLNLALPAAAGATFFNQTPNVTVQLVNSTGTCWTSAFVQGDTTTNDADLFKARFK